MDKSGNLVHENESTEGVLHPHYSALDSLGFMTRKIWANTRLKTENTKLVKLVVLEGFLVLENLEFLSIFPRQFYV